MTVLAGTAVVGCQEINQHLRARCCAIHGFLDGFEGCPGRAITPCGRIVIDPQDGCWCEL